MRRRLHPVNVSIGVRNIRAKSGVQGPLPKKLQINTLGTRLALRPEPDNPHDGFAVEIHHGPAKLDYVPRFAQKMLGRNVSWAAVGTSTAVGAGSGGATVLAAQTIESQFGKQLAKSVIARKLLPGASRSVARSVLSGGLASAGVGAVVRATPHGPCAAKW